MIQHAQLVEKHVERRQTTLSWVPDGRIGCWTWLFDDHDEGRHGDT